MKALLAALFTSAFLLTSTPAPVGNTGAELAALRTIAATHGEAIWSGFGTAPFGMLMIDSEQEVLLCHPSTPAGFTIAGRDTATGCDRLVRGRSSLPPSLLAALPIFGPPSTIVVGTAAATGVSPDRWRSTVLHEHFHQWQDALPDFYPRVAALDLADGDETGMWMLNFPFPYEDETVGRAFDDASQALAEAVAARGRADFTGKLDGYVVLRRAFATAAGERNWRYFEFQLWKEGTARWTEVAIGRASGNPAMIAEAERREGEIVDDLRRPDLNGKQRVVVYSYGAGEAMLLEACGPEWRSAYPTLLALGPLLETAAARCGARRT